jgi:hypothetical protein
MSTQSKLQWPKGASHLRIESGGKHTTVVKEDAEAAITGVAGTITFLRRVKEKGKAETFVSFVGSIPNPLVQIAPKVESVETPPVPVAADVTTADVPPVTSTPAPVAYVDALVVDVAKPEPTVASTTGTGSPTLSMGANIVTFVGKNGPVQGELTKKFWFIASLMCNDNINKYTVSQIAEMVLQKFPNEELRKKSCNITDDETAKTKAYIRAVPYHLNKKGIAHGYASEIEWRNKQPKPTAETKPESSDTKAA